MAAYLENFKGPVPVIGLRINPVVGAGEIAMMSTAGKQSKFGLPLLKDTQDRIVQLFKVMTAISKRLSKGYLITYTVKAVLESRSRDPGLFRGSRGEQKNGSREPNLVLFLEGAERS